MDSGVSLGELDPDHNGYFAGGIIGCTTAKTTLNHCTNYGGVQHPVAAGGLTGVSDGTITDGRMVNSMGNQQEGLPLPGRHRGHQQRHHHQLRPGGKQQHPRRAGHRRRGRL